MDNYDKNSLLTFGVILNPARRHDTSCSDERNSKKAMHLCNNSNNNQKPLKCNLLYSSIKKIRFISNGFSLLSITCLFSCVKKHVISLTCVHVHMSYMPLFKYTHGSDIKRGYLWSLGFTDTFNLDTP